MHIRNCLASVQKIDLFYLSDIYAILTLGFPLILSQCAQTSILFIDAFFMGQLGPQELAGGGLALSAFYLCYMLSFGVISATGNIVSQAHSAGHNHDIIAAVRVGVLLSFVLSLIFGALLWNVKPFMLMLNQDPCIADIAQRFLHILVFAMPFGLLFLTLRCLITSINQPKSIPLITVSALILATLLDWGLSKTLGIYGIALATVFTYVYTGVSLSIIIKHHPSFHLYSILSYFNEYDWKMLRLFLKIGLPTAGTFGLESSLFNASVWFMGSLGVAQLAAHQSMMQIVIISFTIPLGFMYAVSIRVGQAAGVNDWAKVRRLTLAGKCLVLLWTLPIMAILILKSDLLFNIFLPEGHKYTVEARSVARSIAPWAAFLCMLDGWQVLVNGVLRALKDVNITLIIYLVSCWMVGLPLAWWLSRGYFCAMGVWLGMCFSLVLVCLLLQIRFEILSRRMENI